MNLPFTIEQFIEVFTIYNNLIWPFQIILNLLAIIVIILSIKSSTIGNKVICCILGFFWLWMGIGYQLILFSTINKAAYIFGVFFIIQGILFVLMSVFGNKFTFQLKFDGYGIVGIILILYSLIIYPIIGYTFGHIYPQQPTFGLPCPTTIFTFGILLLSNKKVPFYLMLIPLIWSIIGFSAAINLTIKEDFGLLISGISGFVLIIIRNKIIHQ
jgi:hypothetical protein